MRLDAWVMPRSWAHWETVGYEIKVNRGDFLRDEKWKAYLDYCHKFYFVAPPGIIEKEELPEGIGLMVTSKNGTRLYIKRRAAAREVDIPIALLIYVLMCRTEVRGEWNPDLSRAEFWQNWVKTKGDLKEIGWRASKRIREMIDHEIVLARTTNERLQTENENLRQVKDFCERNKIPLGYSVEYRLAQMMENANGAEIISDINRTIESLEIFKSQIRPATKP